MAIDRSFNLLRHRKFDEKQKAYLQLAKLCTLADNHDVHKLKHECIDHMFIVYPKGHGPPNLDLVRHIYSNTISPSLFCGIFAG